jgi:hypothetical protein
MSEELVFEIAIKHNLWYRNSDNERVIDGNADAAIREAIRKTYIDAAEVAEYMYDKTYWDDPISGIAAELRRRAGLSPATSGAATTSETDGARND